MGNRGRFGKYGDNKRIARLRKARIGAGCTQGVDVNPLRRLAGHKKKTSPRGRQITLRLVDASDMDFIRSLSRDAFHKYGPYEEILPRWFLSGMTVTLLALMGKEPVGFAMLGRHQLKWYSPRVSELLAIAVEGGRRRLGIADLLMKEIERRARELQVDTLVLHTGTKNLAGQGLFRKCGFTPSLVRQTFYPGGQDALMMVKYFF